jgi:hypothetical protein
LPSMGAAKAILATRISPRTSKEFLKLNPPFWIVRIHNFTKNSKNKMSAKESSELN